MKGAHYPEFAIREFREEQCGDMDEPARAAE
jgi:hypothetical protein